VRNAFAAWLCRNAESDERVRVLTGDLGFTVFDEFIERYPDRFLNVGVAEQNMVGVATGLAEAGYIPFVYSIATFASMRPYEFVRNGPLLHQLPVRVVGVGAGFDYGVNGVTHYSLEDVAIMRSQPSMTVVAPADRDQTAAALDAIWDLPGALYLRLGKGGDAIPGLGGRFELGCSTTIRDGGDVALIGLGGIAGELVTGAEQLAAKGIEASVTVVSSLTAEADPELLRILSEASLALTVEAAYTKGGLGSEAAELIAEGDLPCRLVRCGVEAMPHGISGSTSFLNDQAGISARRLVETALREVAVTSG
jgi:transketolase